MLKPSVLEAGAFCVEVLVLHGVHTFQCLKIEMGPSVLRTFGCLGVCWVIPSRVLVFVYLLEICVDLVCRSSDILLLFIFKLLGWGFYIAWSFFCTFIFLKHFKGVFVLHERGGLKTHDKALCRAEFSFAPSVRTMVSQTDMDVLDNNS
jgi:hypothetical protein